MSSETNFAENGKPNQAGAYPIRPKFYALKLARQLYAAEVAKHHGPDVLALLIFIGVKEDALGYAGPVAIFNEEFQHALGWAKWERTARARAKAIEKQLLHYDPAPRGSRLPGTYWTVAPDDTPEHIPEREIDERAPPANGYGQGYGEGYGQGYGQGELSSPVLRPDPKPKRERARFKPPTLQEVFDFCKEEKLTNVDAQGFIDFYESNGWRVGKNPMRSWRASARGWHRRNFDGAKKNGSFRNEQIQRQTHDPKRAGGSTRL